MAATDSGYILKAVEDGFPARVVLYQEYILAPAAKTRFNTVVPCDVVIEKLEITPGDCGNANATEVDVHDDGASIWVALPTIGNADTNGVMQTFYPDPAKAKVAAGSTLAVIIEAAATACADFNLTLWGVTRKRMP